ncbi:MAG: hypothetical protein AABP62_14635 [Planctomycetota bacterium]
MADAASVGLDAGSIRHDDLGFAMPWRTVYEWFRFGFPASSRFPSPVSWWS